MLPSQIQGEIHKQASMLKVTFGVYNQGLRNTTWIITSRIAKTAAAVAVAQKKE